MNTNEWLEKVRERINARNDNRPFELKDLFVGEEWNQLSRGERSTLGRAFAAEVRAGKFSNVQVVSLGKSRHNRYQRIV